MPRLPFLNRTRRLLARTISRSGSSTAPTRKTSQPLWRRGFGSVERLTRRQRTGKGASFRSQTVPRTARACTVQLVRKRPCNTHARKAREGESSWCVYTHLPCVLPCICFTNASFAGNGAERQPWARQQHGVHARQLGLRRRSGLDCVQGRRASASDVRRGARLVSAPRTQPPATSVQRTDTVGGDVLAVVCKTAALRMKDEIPLVSFVASRSPSIV